MFHNISNPKWFGNWSRLEDDYLGNGGTDIADNFTFSKMEKTGGLFGSIVRLATAFPACDPETGHATGAWKVACESIDLDEVPLSDIADMISGFDCETITDFRLFNTGAFDNTLWQQALGELLLRLRIEKDDYQWIQCPNSESAVNMMNMVMDAHMPKDFFDDFVCGDEEYGLNEEAHIQNEGGAPLPEDALGTPEEQGIRAMLIATGEPPREVTLLPDKNGSTLKPLQALVGGNIETFDIAFGEGVSLYVNGEGLFTCPPNRAIFATEEMAKAGYLSQLDYSKVVEMGDFYTVLNGDIVAVGFDPETGESRSLTDGETARVEGYFTVISRPGSGAKAVDDIRHGITPGSYDISVESHDCTSGRNALAADAPGKDNQNIG